MTTAPSTSRCGRAGSCSCSTASNALLRPETSCRSRPGPGIAGGTTVKTRWQIRVRVEPALRFEEGSSRSSGPVHDGHTDAEGARTTVRRPAPRDPLSPPRSATDVHPTSCSGSCSRRWPRSRDAVASTGARPLPRPRDDPPPRPGSAASPRATPATCLSSSRAGGASRSGRARDGRGRRRRAMRCRRRPAAGGGSGSRRRRGGGGACAGRPSTRRGAGPGGVRGRRASGSSGAA